MKNKKLQDLETKYKELGEEIEKLKNEKPVKQQIFDILNENFNGCEVELEDGYIYYEKNGDYLFEQNLKSQYFYINNSKIWEVFYDKSELNYDDVQAITKDWVWETLNLKGYTAIMFPNKFI